MLITSRYMKFLLINLILILILISSTYHYYPIYSDSDGSMDSIFINEDGSITPSDAPIKSIDNYQFVLTGNINKTIIIKRSGIRLSGNGYIIHNVDIGVSASGVYDVNIVNITFRNCGVGIDVKGLEFIFVKNVTFIDCDFGAKLSYINMGFISNSTFINVSKGIYIGNKSVGIRVYGNLIRNYDCGILVSDSREIDIQGNKVSIGWDGIHILNSNNIGLMGNYISGNNESGIRIEAHQEEDMGILIAGNILTHNQYGIRLIHAGNNIIRINSIWGNSIGILFEEADDNRIYLNSFKSNDKDVYDIGLEHPDEYEISSNLWDYGYDGGGNYWDKYNGVDLYSGPNQDVNGSDGFYDEPYVLYGDNIDHYPYVHDTNVVKPRKPPHIDVSKREFIAGPSCMLTFELVLYGRDPYEYGISVYVIRIIYPEGWRVSQSDNMIPLSPALYSSMSSIITNHIKTPSNATPGNYSVTIEVYNFIDKSIEATLNLTVWIFKPLSNIEIKDFEVEKRVYQPFSEVEVNLSILNLDDYDGVICPVIELKGPVFSYMNYTFESVYIDSEPIYIESKTLFNGTIKIELRVFYPGAYSVSILVYNASRGFKDAYLIAKYGYEGEYLIEVKSRESYIQMSDYKLDDEDYKLIYIYISSLDIEGSKLSYSDLGATLKEVGSKLNKTWVYRLGLGFLMMDKALGPYLINFSRSEGLKVSVLFRDGKGYVIDKSPLYISGRDIDPGKYIHGYFIQDLSSKYIWFSRQSVSANYSFIKLTFTSDNNILLTLNIDGKKINSTDTLDWPKGFVYYRMDNKSIIVLPFDIGRFCIYLNRSVGYSGESGYRIILESVKNGMNVSRLVRDGEVDADGVKFCIDVVRGIFRITEEAEPIQPSIVDIFIGLAASLVIVGILYIFMRRRERR